MAVTHPNCSLDVLVIQENKSDQDLQRVVLRHISSIELEVVVFAAVTNRRHGLLAVSNVSTNSSLVQYHQQKLRRKKECWCRDRFLSLQTCLYHVNYQFQTR